MTKLIITALLAFFCAKHNFRHPTGVSKKYIVTHYNITFSPDLSNRVNPKLYPRPLNDMELLKVITGNLHPSILRCKRSQNQKDRLQIDFINKGLITRYKAQTDRLLIDFGGFSNQLARIQYIMNTSAPKPTLRQDLNAMTFEFNRIYGLSVKENVGADIWTYLDQGINSSNVLDDEKPRDEDNITIINHYRNVLILPTDGYIEAGIFGKGYDLSKQTIDRFRKAYLTSRETDLVEFFNNNETYHIKPTHNVHLKNLEILVMELYDRSLTKSGSATAHPTDLEIIKLFWTDWLKKSGVKHFELHPCANSKEEAEKIILNFLEVPKMS